MDSGETRHQLGVIEAALDAIAADARSQLCPQERLEVLSLCSRAVERVQALHAVLVAEADESDASVVAKGAPLTSWLSMDGRTPPREAAGMVYTGRDLNQTAAVREAALAGQVRVRQARAIAKTVRGLPDELSEQQKSAAIEVLLERAQRESADRLAKAGPEVLELVAPELVPDPIEQAEARRKRAWHRRFLRLSPDGDGSILIQGSLPDLEAAALKKLIASYVESDRRRGREVRDPLSEQRTPEQRNADALLQLIQRHERGRRAPGVAGDRPRVVITMSFDRLRDQAEQVGLLDDGVEVGAGELRRLCCDADITPVVLGGASEILDVGHTQRLVTAAQRRALSLRDGGCVFFGCDKPDSECEAHHVLPVRREALVSSKGVRDP